MVDEIFDRTYHSGREALHADIDSGLAKLGRSVLTTFRAMRAIQFAAPWRNSARTIECA